MRGALSITDFEWMGEGDKIDLAEQWEKILLDSESAAMMNRGNGVTQCLAECVLQRGRTILMPCIQGNALQPCAGGSTERQDSGGSSAPIAVPEPALQLLIWNLPRSL